MEVIPAWFLFIIIQSVSAGSLAPTGQYVENPELYEAMKVENIVKEFGPEVVDNAPFYDPDKDHIFPAHGPGEEPSTLLVQFYLYSSMNPEKGQRIVDFSSETSRRIFEKDFNKTAPTKIICHGFLSNYTAGPGSLLRSAYFKAYKHVNVILINWSSLAGWYKAAPKPNTLAWDFPNWLYFPPARNTKTVGNRTAEFISFLVNNFGVSLSNIHLVGHSLGAHAMGFAGLAVQSDLKEKVGRITGLDPAGPCFESMYWVCFLQHYRAINKTDAQFVDIIHTDSKMYGMTGAVGNVDFYPNGGRQQPECSSSIFEMCSHHRAIEQMRDSLLFGTIVPGQKYLKAKTCSSWDDYNNNRCTSAATSELGEFCSFPSNGTYYLKIKPLNKWQMASFLIFKKGVSVFMPRSGTNVLHATA